MRAELGTEPPSYFQPVCRCRRSCANGKGNSAAPAPAPAVHSEDRKSSRGHLGSERRGAAEVDQRGPGAPAEALRGRQDERHPGPRESHPRGQPQPPAAPKRDQGAEGEGRARALEKDEIIGLERT